MFTTFNLKTKNIQDAFAGHSESITDLQNLRNFSQILLHLIWVKFCAFICFDVAPERGNPNPQRPWAVRLISFSIHSVKTDTWKICFLKNVCGSFFVKWFLELTKGSLSFLLCIQTSIVHQSNTKKRGNRTAVSAASARSTNYDLCLKFSGFAIFSQTL